MGRGVLKKHFGEQELWKNASHRKLLPRHDAFTARDNAESALEVRRCVMKCQRTFHKSAYCLNTALNPLGEQSPDLNRNH